VGALTTTRRRRVLHPPAALVVALLAAWFLADIPGALELIQKSLRTLLNVKSVTFRPATIALCGSGAGLVLVVAGVTANTLASLIYNLISRLAGGVALDSTGES
jgi:hypothetical protein